MRSQLAQIGSWLGRWVARARHFMLRRLGMADEPTADITTLTRKEWRRVGMETWAAIFDRKLLTLSGGVAFYTTIALLPTTAAVLAIISRTLSPEEALFLINEISHLLPEEFARFIREQLPALTEQKLVSDVALIGAVILALWTGSAAMDNLMNALNVAYGLKDRRNFWQFKGTSTALLIITVTLMSGIVALLLISTNGLARAGLPTELIQTFVILRWLSVFFLTAIVVLVLYRFAPNHHTPRIKWMSWGALIAAVAWFIATSLFFYYVQFIADFSQAFGILAGMFVLMAWLELSSLILIMGATVNGRLTHHAEKRYRETL